MKKDLSKLLTFLKKEGFDSEHSTLTRVISASWYDSMSEYIEGGYNEFSSLAEMYFDEYLPHTPFGATLTALIGLMPKGHSVESTSGFDMSNFHMFESEESFFYACKDIASPVSQFLAESMPVTGDIVDFKNLSESLIKSINAFMMGDAKKGSDYAQDAALMSVFILTPNILEKLAFLFKSGYAKLFKSEIPQAKNTGVVYEESVDSALDSYKKHYYNKRHYDVDEFEQPSTFYYSQKHSMNFNTPKASVIEDIGVANYNHYIDNIESNIIDKFTLVDGDISRPFFIIKDPRKNMPAQVWYKSSGSGGGTSAGEFSRIDGLSHMDGNDWYAKTYRAKTPAPGTVDADIKKVLEERSPSPGKSVISYGDDKLPYPGSLVDYTHYPNKNDVNDRLFKADTDFQPRHAVNKGQSNIEPKSFQSLSQTASAMRRNNFITSNYITYSGSGSSHYFSFGPESQKFISRMANETTNNPAAKSVLDIYVVGSKGNAGDRAMEFSKDDIVNAFNYFNNRQNNLEVAKDILNHTEFKNHSPEKLVNSYGMQIANSVGLVLESCIEETRALWQAAESDGLRDEFDQIFEDFIKDLPADMMKMIKGESGFKGLFLK